MSRGRFRRRQVGVLLLAGLLPLLLWAAASWTLIDRVLAVSLDPLQEVLDRADERLAGEADTAALRAELTTTRLSLAQAELGRRSLLRLAPWGFLAVILTSGAILIVVALVLARTTSRRLERLAEGADSYARGELSHRLPTPTVATDEIDELVVRFNQLGGELEAERRRLAVSEALAAWQEVARTLAHELKNPLTAIRLSVARLSRQGELVEALSGEVDTLLRMTESFSDFAKLPAPVVRALELRPLLADVCALYDVALEPGGELRVAGDADQLRRAFGNLIKNALEAGGPVEVSLAGDTVSVRDHGPGVTAPLDGRRLVTTLGTTKVGGSGLGLPVVAKIVHDHGGALRLEPAPGGGARALVRLPGAAS